MHTHTIRTKFTFGDRVRFDSKLQHCFGVGKVFAFTVDDQQHVDYMIAIDHGGYDDLQAGIQEDEITLLSDTE